MKIYLKATTMDAIILFGAAALFGVVVHQAFFKRVEVDTHPLLIFTAFAGAPFVLKAVLGRCFDQYAGITTLTSISVVACSILSLWTSMLVYRAFFHPLRHFPGPFGARLSKFWALSQTAKSGMRWYQVDEVLHQRYGDYVRTGNYQLSS